MAATLCAGYNQVVETFLMPLMPCRLLCDDVWMHGLYHLEILPGGQAEQARPRPSKSGKKGEASTNDEALDLDAAQAVVRQLNVNDLTALQRALEDVNICVCFPDMSAANHV